MKNNWLSKFIFLLSILAAAEIFAGGGNFASFHGTHNLSLNGLYFAGNNGAYSLLSNPAGLAYSNGLSVEAVVYDKSSQYRFDANNSDLFKSFREDDFKFGGGLAWRLSNMFSVGVAYMPVLNQNLNWPYTVFKSKESVAEVLSFDMARNLQINSISSGLSVKLGDLILGAGFSYYNATLSSYFPIDNGMWLSADSGRPAYQFKYDLDGNSFGFNLGLLYHYSSVLHFALSANTGYNVDLEGTANTQLFADIDSIASTVNSSSSLEIPLSVNFGLLYSIENNLNLNFDFSFHFWGNTNQNKPIAYKNQIWNDRLNNTDTSYGINPNRIIDDLENSFDIGVGLEYEASESMSYKCGYSFRQSPLSEKSFNLLAPSGSDHTVSVGLTLKSDLWDIDFGLAYSFGIQSDVNRTDLTILNGSYDGNMLNSTINIRYNLNGF